jgi:hypothetical protein
MLHARILSVASFGNRINFRVPAYVLDPGQVFLKIDQWRKIAMGFASFVVGSTPAWVNDLMY